MSTTQTLAEKIAESRYLQDLAQSTITRTNDIIERWQNDARMYREYASCAGTARERNQWHVRADITESHINAMCMAVGAYNSAVGDWFKRQRES